MNNYVLLIIVYPIIRLFCEFFRDERKVFLNLSTGQIFSIILFILGMILLVITCLNKKKKKEIDLEKKA